jgi:predicted metal-dependent HD superfamily phosphohydrolase
MADPARLRFSGLWRRLGALGTSDAVFDRLAAAYGEPGRAYHTLDHVMDCLALLDDADLAATERDPMEAAIWFHDMFYDSRRRDNEDRSAEWAEQTLSAASVPAKTAARVAQLIRMTDHSSPPADAAGQLLCDLDLAILGRDEAEFDEYQRRIREEYQWVSDPLYRAGRARVLSGLANRTHIYVTQSFRDRYEAAARANLQRALAGLES